MTLIKNIGERGNFGRDNIEKERNTRNGQSPDSSRSVFKSRWLRFSIKRADGDGEREGEQEEEEKEEGGMRSDFSEWRGTRPKRKVPVPVFTFITYIFLSYAGSLNATCSIRKRPASGQRPALRCPDFHISLQSPLQPLDVHTPGERSDTRAEFIGPGDDHVDQGDLHLPPDRWMALLHVKII